MLYSFFIDQKKIKFLVPLLVFLFVYGCVQDDFSNYQDVSVQEINDYTFNKISFSDLKKKNTKALQKIEKISSLKNKALGRNHRMDYNEQFGVFIDTTQIVMLSNEDQHTITFRIVSEGENDKEVENLVLRSRQNGEYSAYITKYELSEAVGNELLNASLVSIAQIDNNYQTNMLGNVSDCIDTRIITRSFCRDKEGNVFGYDDKGEVDTRCHGMPYTETHLTIYIDLKCMGGGAGSGAYTGGGGYGTGGYDYSIGGSYEGGSGGGSSGNTGGGNTSNPNQPGNGNTNSEDGLFDGYTISPFPTTPVFGQLTPPQQEPINHIAELNKITNKDTATPFRAKIDEYIGTWEYNQNGHYFKIQFYKQIAHQEVPLDAPFKIKYKTDRIRGYFQYKINEVEIYNTRLLYNDGWPFVYSSSGSFTSRGFLLYYEEPSTSPCGRPITGKVILEYSNENGIEKLEWNRTDWRSGTPCGRGQTEDETPFQVPADMILIKSGEYQPPPLFQVEN